MRSLRRVQAPGCPPDLLLSDVEPPAPGTAPRGEQSRPPRARGGTQQRRAPERVDLQQRAVVLRLVPEQAGRGHGAIVEEERRPRRAAAGLRPLGLRLRFGLS